jgi:hypothetical protein
LTQDESLQLFSRHAFGTTHPPEDYAELSNDVLKCACALPLALEVLGASLFGKDSLSNVSPTSWKTQQNLAS